MKKIIFTFILTLSLIIFTPISSAWLVDFGWKSTTASEDVTKKLEAVSITSIDSQAWTLAENIDSNWRKILSAVKWIVWWIMVIYMVYVWIMMIMSMWSDEEQLSSSKRQLRYVLIAFLFINIPWTIYHSFHKETANDTTVDQWQSWNTFTDDWLNDSESQIQNNILVDDNILFLTNDAILGFINILISFIAVAVIMFSWLKILSARWREDQVKEAKSKIIYSVFWLIFVWIANIWKNIAFSWNIEDGQNLFSQLSNLALYFAWPIWIFFLVLAWYHMVTANWDEEKIKKAKNIVINTLIATVILLASYSFLLDLWDLVW